MSKKISGKKLASNLIISLIAQAISIITSFVLNFIVPKFIDNWQYSYWQMYMLYVGYVGVLHFGLLDGLVLRYSQYDYDELDKPRIRSQFRLLLGANVVFAVAGCATAFFVNAQIASAVLVFVSCGIITKNIFTYTSYTFQITNRITRYAVLVIVQRAAYALMVITLLVCKVNNFYWYCIADLFGDVCGIVLGLFLNRGLYFGRCLPFRDSLTECWRNISSGINLMIATFSAILLVSSAKMIVQWHWDELVFGQLSFSFSVSNAFMTFLTAVSVVLFPSLKRMDESALPHVYIKLRNVISPLLFFAIIMYFPVCWILRIWLPSYTDSLVYLGIMLPIIVFSSKVNLLTNNYLKTYRKERLMLIVNVASVVAGMVLFLIGAYALDNITFILYSLVGVIMLNSVSSEFIVASIIKKSIIQHVVIEFIMTAVFIVSVQMLPLGWACLVYFCALIVYALLYRKSLSEVLKSLLGMFKKKEPSAAGDKE